MAEVAEDPRSAAGGAAAAGMLRDARTPPKSWSDLEPPTAWWANPFALRVGQVFTGFGVGCGVGIGVGRPVNLGALPAAGAVASMAGDFNRLAAGAAAPLRPLVSSPPLRPLPSPVACKCGRGTQSELTTLLHPTPHSQPPYTSHPLFTLFHPSSLLSPDSHYGS
ncbi:unnamed protein product [Closterium sp. Naga37s-1]|nr:unnamed protein product [Closterium sp. Naga37s-1]